MRESAPVFDTEAPPADLPAAPAPARGVRIQDMPADERPREKMLKHGPASLTDAELLALFFRTGMQGLSAIDIGRKLIEKYGDLTTIGRLKPAQLQREKGLGPAKALDLAAAYELGKRLAEAEWDHRPMDDAAVVAALLGPQLRAEPVEVVKMLLLNTKLNLIGTEDVSRGGLRETTLAPREVLRLALLHNAHGFVIAHNHPSGDPKPSSADIEVTKRLREASKLVDVRFVDHVIIGMPLAGRQSYFSFKQAGVL